MSDYIEHLEAKLRDVDRGIKLTQSRFESCEPELKTKELAELSRLKMRRDELAQRIEWAKSEGAEGWSNLQKSLRAEADGLADALERLLLR
jgi:hypothetical protein